MPASSSIAMPIGRRSGRTEFGQEYRDAQPDRNADQHRDDRRHQRAVNRRGGAETLLGRAPGVVNEEIQAEMPERGPRADEQRDRDAEQQDQNQRRCSERHQAKAGVPELQPAERGAAISGQTSGGLSDWDRRRRHRPPRLSANSTRSRSIRSANRDGGETAAPSGIAHFCWMSVAQAFLTRATTFSGIGM